METTSWASVPGLPSTTGGYTPCSRPRRSCGRSVAAWWCSASKRSPAPRSASSGSSARPPRVGLCSSVRVPAICWSGRGRMTCPRAPPRPTRWNPTASSRRTSGTRTPGPRRPCTWPPERRPSTPRRRPPLRRSRRPPRPPRGRRLGCQCMPGTRGTTSAPTDSSPSRLAHRLGGSTWIPPARFRDRSAWRRCGSGISTASSIRRSA
mmetsp:Transcript_153335/g.491664  ORF Transcript_153335/g.491664 Transcript_153335/m.491664 type:complete len:207 (-) Transcript_153335:150-770(-)